MTTESLTLAAVGDISTNAEPPESAFRFTEQTLRRADLRFGQVERVYSGRGSYQQQAIAPHSRHHPSRASAFSHIPFNVLSIGSNHTGDWGPEGTEDTYLTFEKLGIPTIAAGRNIEEARREVVLSHAGLKVAFLGYVSVLLPQTWATESRPGAAPMRAHSLYEPYEFQPGSPARAITVPFEEDLELMRSDIRRARSKADLVVVSFHWGVHFIPKPLADYQPVVAHAAIDAGASLIIGTHPHCIQAVEIYRKAPILYSLGNFSMPRKPGTVQAHHVVPNGYHSFADVYTREMEPGYTYQWNRFFKESGIAWIKLDSDGVANVDFLPTIMNEEGIPEIIEPGTEKFDYFRDYFKWVSKGLAGGVSEIGVQDGRLRLYQR